MFKANINALEKAGVRDDPIVMVGGASVTQAYAGLRCPMTGPKTLRNRPCTGVRPDGGCEVKLFSGRDLSVLAGWADVTS